jgi:hypothetical protein
VCHDTAFNKKRLYTAWGNLKNENIFCRSERLTKHRIPPTHLMTYMCSVLTSWRHGAGSGIATSEGRLGVRPYPMADNRNRADMICNHVRVY